MIRASERQSSSGCNICLLVPDGRGVRNFVLGKFLKLASRQGRVDVLHSISADLLPTYQNGLNGNVHWHSLIPYPDRPLPFVLQNCLSYAQMYWIDNFPMHRTLNRPVSGSWRWKTAHRVARGVGKLAACPAGIRVLDRLHTKVACRVPEVQHYQNLFRAIRPDVVFCSHQRPPQVLPAVLAAKSLGIPTATFIFSWDNLSSKGRIAAPFDHFLVWSDHMWRELRRFYPDVSDERIHIVGTPQFDPYADDSLVWSREIFFQRIGADSSRPLICYSGGDAHNASEDPLHVAVLLEHIRTGRIQRRPQVLLRPCPSDDGSRFEKLHRQYPELIYAQPSWHHTRPGDWAAVLPSSEDVQFLVNLTRYADLNINFASTMTLDFAIHDKPVINLAFDVSDPPRFGMPMWDYYQKWDHYRPVIQLGAARFAHSGLDLATRVNGYLLHPALDVDGRRQFRDLQVGVPVGYSIQTVINVLRAVALKQP